MQQSQQEAPYHQEHAHQFIIYLKSGKGEIVWGDFVSEADGVLSVMSADGSVIQMFPGKDVASWRVLPAHSEENDRDAAAAAEGKDKAPPKPTGNDLLSGSDIE